MTENHRSKFYNITSKNRAFTIEIIF